MGERKVVVFSVAGEQYAADVDQIAYIERVPVVTPIPGAAPFVLGIGHVRGQTLPVIDLRTRLRYADCAITSDTRMLAVSMHGMVAGLVIDTALDVMDVGDGNVDEEAVAVSGIRRDYLQGVVCHQGRIIVILRLDRIIDADEARQIRLDMGVVT